MTTRNDIDQQVLRELAPHGVLRAAINFGNIVLAQPGGADQPPKGVSVDIARELGAALGVPVAFATFDAAGKVFDALGSDVWDLAFLAVEPARGEKIAFSPPYLHIEGAYLVRAAAPWRHAADLDRPGARIAVGTGSAYDLFLTRTLKHASIERQQGAAAAFRHFADEGLDAVAGIRQVVEGWAAKDPDLRVVEPAFMVIRQAMGVPKAHAVAAAFLAGFIETLKADGRIARFLERSGQVAAIAPASR